MNIIQNSNGTFYGCSFGNNLVINNGRIVNGNPAKSKRFDEAKSEEAKNVEKITIISTFCDVDVSVSSSSSSKIEAHLHGEAILDGNVTLDFSLSNSELKIEVKSTANCFSGKLSLDISIPQKTFDVLCIKSTSADITLNKGVSVDCLKVNTTSGELETYADFNSCLISTISGYVFLSSNPSRNTNVNISTISGDIDFLVNTYQNINVNISTTSGYVHFLVTKPKKLNAKISTTSGIVSAAFSIRNVDVSTSTVTGKVDNWYNVTGHYSNVVDISTISGSITIH